jgi:alpha-tubulin suppressor-like RCC1 family protein
MLLLSRKGLVFSCGRGQQGQLGHSDTETRESPRLISLLADKPVVQIVAAEKYSLVRTHAGAVYGFGDNKDNHLCQPCEGNNDESKTTEAKTAAGGSAKAKLLCPASLGFCVPIADISSTNRRTAALTRDGRLLRCGTWLAALPATLTVPTVMLSDVLFVKVICAAALFLLSEHGQVVRFT